jgi:hypothetical protein
MDLKNFLEFEKLINDKDKLKFLNTYCLNIEAKLISLKQKHFVEVFDKDRRLKDVLNQLPGAFLENNKMSNFIDNCNIHNYSGGTCPTLLYNKFFTFYFDRDFTVERDYFDFVEVKIATRNKSKIWTDEKHINGYSLSRCINFLLNEKLLVNDLNLKITAFNFYEVRNDLFEKNFKKHSIR